jgi:sterol desaturase/sphingolipid hydroxylase (fatty acid hydroxylase superfamily)
MSLTPAQVIVLATPVFLALIAIEFAVGWRRGRNTYRLADAISSIGLGMMSQVVGLFTKLAAIGIYTAVYEQAALFELSTSAIWVWVAGLLLYDFFYYWLHRFGHTVALLWAAHSVHHQSEDYNLSTALRQTSSGWIAGWLFYLPMAVLGIPPLVFGVVALVDLLYQYWVHTQQIGKLGWFDRWFCSPSNHRVHHAVNDKYLDKNFGGILVVWDRLFGTFVEEDDAQPCVYGTLKPLRSWNPLWANLAFYAELAQDSWRTRRWRDKLWRWVGLAACGRGGRPPGARAGGPGACAVGPAHVARAAAGRRCRVPVGDVRHARPPVVGAHAGVSRPGRCRGRRDGAAVAGGLAVHVGAGGRAGRPGAAGLSSAVQPPASNRSPGPRAGGARPRWR